MEASARQRFWPSWCAPPAAPIRCADPLLSLSDIGGNLRGARSELARLDAILNTPPLPEPAEPIRPERRNLRFDSVTFRQNGRTVVDDLTLSVPEGR